MSDTQVARLRQAGYTESEASESAANIALNLFPNFPTAGTVLDFLPAAPLTRG